ncbi:MAG: aminoglycoside phosphotransferase family protein [Caldilinea sp. CFX5]|nr:aminoglycoside phosphotransferase family protein [Caldilinea sp. CFX5]
MSAVQALPSDQTMPQLQVALDPLMMQVIFQKMFATDAAAVQVDSCVVERVKYKAGEKCVISYLLRLYDPERDCCHEQRLAARFFPAGLSEARYQKALCEPLTPPPYGNAVMHLPELAMVLWAFPNDRKIATLPHLLATAAQDNDELGAIVTNLFGEAHQIVHHRHRLVHYVPEQTCTVCVELQVAPPPVVLSVKQDITPAATEPQKRPVQSSGKVRPVNPEVCSTLPGRCTRQPADAPQPLTLFGKAYYNDDGAETYRLMNLLWAEKQGHGLRIAQPLAYDPQTRILWQKGLPGRTLLSYPLGSPVFNELLQEAARSVARLHRAMLPCARQSRLADWVVQLCSIQQLLEDRHPASQATVAALVAALHHQAPTVDRAPAVTLHGDLHLQNFLVDETASVGQRVALIDLDNLSTGSPWRDLGSFCAGLYHRGLVEALPTPSIRQAIDAFCVAYAAVAPWPLEPQTIAWYTATALLNERAFRSVSRLKHGRLDLLDDLIGLAGALL